MPAPTVRILAIAKLPHAFANHFQPLADCAAVEQVIALRPLRWSRGGLRAIRVIDFERLPMPLSLVGIGICGAVRAVREDYDAIVAFTPVPYGLIGLFVSRLSRTPLHVGIIDERPLERLSGIRRILTRWVVHNADTLSVPAGAGSAAAIGVRSNAVRKDRVFALPHGLVDEFFAPPLGERSFAGLFVGDLLAVKRVGFIIRVWAEVVSRHPDSRLCIVGDGPERLALERLSQSLGLGTSILFAGYQADVLGYYRRSRVFIMASESEGMPFALIEAMACGVVPVVNDVGSIGALVESSVNGVLLPRLATEDQYADRIARLLGDEARLDALGEKAVQSVAHLRYANVTKIWGQIVDRLTG